MLDQELELRFCVLRDPLGLPADAVRFPFERASLHLCAVSEGRVVGCVLFHPEGQDGGKLYQMAVDPAYQGRGVGRRLVQTLEQRLRAEGIAHVRLHARAPAVAFYERLGYLPIGAPFDEIGLEHRAMVRVLTA